MPIYMLVGKRSGKDVKPAGIKGDVSVAGYEGWIQLDEYDFNLRSGDYADAIAAQGAHKKRKKAKAAPKAKAKHGDEKDADAEATPEEEAPERQEQKLGIEKSVDSATCGLMEWAASGRSHDLRIDCCREGNQRFLTLYVTGATLTEFELSEAAEPTEKLELEWALVELEFISYDSRNRPVVSSSGAAARQPDRKGRRASLEDEMAAELAVCADPAEVSMENGAPEMAAQAKRSLVVDKLAGKDYELVAFDGVEGLSTNFRFVLELLSKELATKATDVIGQPLSFGIADDGDKEDDPRPERRFHGIVRDFVAGEMASDDVRRYVAVVVPAFWQLTKRQDCRIFQEKSVKEILQAVLSEGRDDFPALDHELGEVRKTYPKLAYCVQYRESDFDFLSRLMEDAGIFYTFRHEAKRHVLVLADSTMAYADLAEPKVRYLEDEVGSRRLHMWQHRHQLVSGKRVLRDYNFENPADTLEESNATKLALKDAAKREVFDYPGGYGVRSDGKNVAATRMQAEEALHEFIVAASGNESFAPGGKFTLDNHPSSSESGKSYVVLAVHHSAEHTSTGERNEVHYGNNLRCMPASIPYHAPARTPRPRVYGPQTAVVVGSTKDEVVETDKHGRVRVQFHWDRVGKKDDKSSCWLRVSQPLAGKGWGAVAIPRIGQEVVVSFLEGDPDRPLVTGSVYNELLKPAYALPDEKTKTVLRTRSFPDGGVDNYNELSFDDKKDGERVYMHAERDFERVVEHDDILKIGEKEVDGAPGKQTITIVGDQALTITKGHRTRVLEKGNETITLKQGSRETKISAGKDALEAAQSIELKVGGNTIKIDTSSIKLTVGGSTITMQASGIELKIGPSSVKLEGSGVTIKGVMAKIEGSATAEMKSLMTTVKGDAMLTAKGGITMIG